ncbi:MAG: hypothetical protein QOH94_602, partial [Mycobacterium sp.]|nr:hypothetical protein [Mycobacterium sp.]
NCALQKAEIYIDPHKPIAPLNAV